MTNPLTETFTITLTGQEWDSIIGGKDARYARNDRTLHAQTLAKIADYTPGTDVRAAYARGVTDAKRPVIDYDEVTERAALLIDWYENGSREEVSHLGAGAPHQEPLKCGLQTWILRDLPHMGFGLAEFNFAGEYPYYRFTREEADLITVAVANVRPVVETWNETTSGISLKFKPSS
jgi:hypothetical protein